MAFIARLERGTCGSIHFYSLVFRFDLLSRWRNSSALLVNWRRCPVSAPPQQIALSTFIERREAQFGQSHRSRRTCLWAKQCWTHWRPCGYKFCLDFRLLNTGFAWSLFYCGRSVVFFCSLSRIWRFSLLFVLLRQWAAKSVVENLWILTLRCWCSVKLSSDNESRVADVMMKCIVCDIGWVEHQRSDEWMKYL